MKIWSERHPGSGLNLSVVRYRDEAAAERGMHVLLIHGFMDAAGTWEDVARPLAARGLDVWAADMRGFGESDRVGAGGYYHFPDYVRDVDALVREAIDDGPLVVVGHSMGGTVASLFAGARPERVDHLVLIEGIGPPAMPPAIGITRMRRWLDQLADGATGRPPQSREDALRRLGIAHPRVDRAILERKVSHLLSERGGELAWCYDPLHRTTSPHHFDVATFRRYLAEVRCPTLFIGGGPEGFHPPDEAERLAAIGGDTRPTVETLELPGAGHMVHWTRPGEVAAAILRFVLP
jgi:pimeloyl-ACP methyl ester carboxylesterase